ncbi:putative MltA-interacting protein MipA [Thiomonas sp. X19]|uniref:MipA/OmpV family protein n=1 Tax=Thiomonas sp. X19 TaxID=1050370 RepID=UPI000B696501|nr:MipA/OmpV family protein [Thiomonas sp. X19]SCC92595.1 putative MltA-interacting protein MipA [Thiomonas sp. X19]
MLKRRTLVALALSAAALLAGLGPAAAQAVQKPLWEVGLGFGVLSFPDYPGSDQQRSYILPTPYFVYRGEIFKAGRNGFQARLFDTERVDSYLSLSASPPVNSTDDYARSGMPDLKPTIQFGPALDVHLWQSAAQRMRLDFRVPLRTVISVAWHPRQVGWLFAPVLNLDMADVAGLNGWNLGAQTGPLFADRSYNQTYYGVAPACATATRPAYAASGGYAGSQFTLALSKRFPGFWVGGFARYDNLSGAVFADSPLLRRSQNLSAGIGIAWILGQSSQMVDSHE